MTLLGLFRIFVSYIWLVCSNDNRRSEDGNDPFITYFDIVVNKVRIYQFVKNDGGATLPPQIIYSIVGWALYPF